MRFEKFIGGLGLRQNLPEIFDAVLEFGREDLTKKLLNDDDDDDGDEDNDDDDDDDNDEDNDDDDDDAGMQLLMTITIKIMTLSTTSNRLLITLAPPASSSTSFTKPLLTRTSNVKSHTSHVTHHTSQISRHTSHITNHRTHHLNSSTSIMPLPSQSLSSNSCSASNTLMLKKFSWGFWVLIKNLLHGR